MFESITNSAFGGHCSLLHFVKESVINFNSYSLAHLIICPIDLFAMCNEAHIPALDNLVRLLVLFFLFGEWFFLGGKKDISCQKSIMYGMINYEYSCSASQTVQIMMKKIKTL